MERKSLAIHLKTCHRPVRHRLPHHAEPAAVAGTGFPVVAANNRQVLKLRRPLTSRARDHAAIGRIIVVRSLQVPQLSIRQTYAKMIAVNLG
jgi:hypothetical protein